MTTCYKLGKVIGGGGAAYKRKTFSLRKGESEQPLDQLELKIRKRVITRGRSPRDINSDRD